MLNGEQLADRWAEIAPATRQYLERAPLDKVDWRPDPKSGTLGTLLEHVVRMASWPTMVLESDHTEAGPGAATPPLEQTTDGLLAFWDEASAATEKALRQATEEQLLGEWSLGAGDQVWIRDTRWHAISALTFDHLIHHRAQLGSYFRALGVPLPATYGPSADEAH